MLAFRLISKDESLPFQAARYSMTDIPTEQLKEQGKTAGNKLLEERGKQYFSELGKKSAAKRKKDKRFDKRFYSAIAKRSVEARRNKKKAEQEGTNPDDLPPFQMPSNPLHTINNFLKGKV